jgi:hypothetical protein
LQCGYQHNRVPITPFLGPGVLVCRANRGSTRIWHHSLSVKIARLENIEVILAGRIVFRAAAVPTVLPANIRIRLTATGQFVPPVKVVISPLHVPLVIRFMFSLINWTCSGAIPALHRPEQMLQLPVRQISVRHIENELLHVFSRRRRVLFWRCFPVVLHCV